MHVATDHPVCLAISNLEPSDRLDLEHGPFRESAERVRVDECTCQVVRHPAGLIVLLGVTGPKDAEMVTRTNRRKPISQLNLIKVQIEAALPRTEPEVEGE